MNKKVLTAVAIYLFKRQKFKQRITAMMLALLNSQRLLFSMINNQRMLIHLYDSKKKRISTFWENNVPEMDDNSFKNFFRVNRQSFDKICKKVRNIAKKDSNMRLCIPLKKRVAIALYALGSTSEYRAVSELFGVGLSTVSEIVMEFCRIVCDTFDEYISSYPPTVDEIKRVVNGFECLGFPQCFGAIDAYHLEFKPNVEHEFEFCNSEGWCSIILLASCDYNSKFTYVNIGTPGRKTDYSVFRESSLKVFHELSTIFIENSKAINNIDVPVLLIGDSAFRLSNYLMRPYPFEDNQSPHKYVFNYHLQKCHQTIKNAFNELTCRFQKIEKLRMSAENCNIIIKACCFLHNFLKTEEDEVIETWIKESATIDRKGQPKNIADEKSNDEAEAIRNVIAKSFIKLEL